MSVARLFAGIRNLPVLVKAAAMKRFECDLGNDRFETRTRANEPARVMR